MQSFIEKNNIGDWWVTVLIELIGDSEWTRFDTFHSITFSDLSIEYRVKYRSHITTKHNAP